MDFHWGEYTYNLAGGSEIFLSELLGILAENGEDTEELTEISEDLSQVKNVEFSDSKLVQVNQVILVGGEEAEVDDEDETDELIEAESRPDWLLTSLAPFDTEETLTITLKSGVSIGVRVTDVAVPGTSAGGRRVTADGVTYTLSNAGTANGTSTNP